MDQVIASRCGLRAQDTKARSRVYTHRMLANCIVRVASRGRGAQVGTIGLKESFLGGGVPWRGMTLAANACAYQGILTDVASPRRYLRTQRRPVFCRNPRGLFIEICGTRLQQVQANLTGAVHIIVTQRVQCCYRNGFPPSAANWADVWSATFCEVKPMHRITHRLRCVCVESVFFFFFSYSNQPTYSILCSGSMT